MGLQVEGQFPQPSFRIAAYNTPGLGIVWLSLNFRSGIGGKRGELLIISTVSKILGYTGFCSRVSGKVLRIVLSVAIKSHDVVIQKITLPGYGFGFDTCLADTTTLWTSIWSYIRSYDVHIGGVDHAIAGHAAVERSRALVIHIGPLE